MPLYELHVYKAHTHTFTHTHTHYKYALHIASYASRRSEIQTSD